MTLAPVLKGIPRAALLVLLALRSVIAHGAEGAPLRACVDRACVDVGAAEAAAAGGHGARVDVSTSTEQAPDAFPFKVRHQGSDGVVHERDYPLSQPLAPGERRTPAVNQSISIKRPSIPMGAIVFGLPGTAPLHGAPTARTARAALPGARVQGNTPDSPEVKVPSPGGGSRLLSDGVPGDGAGFVLLALAGIVLVAALGAALVFGVGAAVVLGVGALWAVALGHLSAWAMKRERLEWWASIMLMDWSLGLSMVVGLLVGLGVAALGTLGAYAFVAQFSEPQGPLVIAGAAGIVALSAVAVALVGAAGMTVGSILVVVNTALQPAAEPDAAEQEAQVKSPESQLNAAPGIPAREIAH